MPTEEAYAAVALLLVWLACVPFAYLTVRAVLREGFAPWTCGDRVFCLLAAFLGGPATLAAAGFIHGVLLLLSWDREAKW